MVSAAWCDPLAPALLASSLFTVRKAKEQSPRSQSVTGTDGHRSRAAWCPRRRVTGHGTPDQSPSLIWWCI